MKYPNIAEVVIELVEISTMPSKWMRRRALGSIPESVERNLVISLALCGQDLGGYEPQFSVSDLDPVEALTDWYYSDRSKDQFEKLPTLTQQILYLARVSLGVDMVFLSTILGDSFIEFHDIVHIDDTILLSTCSVCQEVSQQPICTKCVRGLNKVTKRQHLRTLVLDPMDSPIFSNKPPKEDLDIYVRHYNVVSKENVLVFTLDVQRPTQLELPFDVFEGFLSTSN